MRVVRLPRAEAGGAPTSLGTTTSVAHEASATESAAILDVCRKLNLDEAKLHAAGREHLLRIVAMLVRLCRPGTGSGTGAPSHLSDGP